MKRFTSLATVRERVWNRLADAASDPGHPYRTLTFGTVQSGRPRLRTVVLRSADVQDQCVSFHTDRRSSKVEDIRQNERIGWLAWDPESREQIRLWGTATVHVDDEIAQSMWEAEDESSLQVYLQKWGPGAALTSPPGETGDPFAADSQHLEDGWSHFAVVQTEITGVDWLHLHPDGHYRAQYDYSTTDGSVQGRWVAP